MASAQGKSEELKKKIFFTFLLLVVYRLTAQVPIPGVDGAALKSYFDQAQGGVLDLFNTFSGGAFKNMTVVALGIMPYITTSIIASLLGEVWPKIKEMQEDYEGQKKIQKYTRYFTVVLCCVQAYGYATLAETFKTKAGIPVIPEPGMLFRLTAVITIAGGTMFLLWLGERITEFGLENGVSLIIFTGIAVELPTEIYQKVTLYRNGELAGIKFLMFFAVVLFTFYVVAFIERSFRGVPVQYAKQIKNNRQFGGTQTLPVRVDTGGVMPPILASTLIFAPLTFANFVGDTSWMKPYIEKIVQLITPGSIAYYVMFAVLIAYMTYFYAPIQFKSERISDNLKKNNAFIPGVRPGTKTKEYLDFILNRMTFFGTLFLVFICIAPTIAVSGNTRFGGTAMLILVSVSVRVMMNIQSFMLADRYQTAYKAKGKYNGNNRKRF